MRPAAQLGHFREVQLLLFTNGVLCFNAGALCCYSLWRGTTKSKAAEKAGDENLEVYQSDLFFFCQKIEVMGNLRMSNVVKSLTNLWTQASLPFTGVEMATKS